ncbi:MAG: SURF1 family protein [Lautropia sp.]|nr:SURF1 family protein [Lautropia sp.]
MSEPSFDSPPRRRPVFVRILAWVFLGLLLLTFLSLGTWQVERLAWKRDLIARVDARIHAPPVSAPPPEQWASVSTARDEYRHVRLRGRLLNDQETLVQASSALGAGYWVLVPVETRDGAIVMVNRGFVPPERSRPGQRASADAASSSDAWVEVVGLLRMPEPGGAFLRSNDPDADRWYSRDVQAIATRRGLAVGRVAPYFIDLTQAPEILPGLDAPLSEVPRWQPPPVSSGEIAIIRWAERRPKRFPMPGLTVVSFNDNHLMYAITWYGLALMVLVAGWLLWREQRRAG